LAFIAHLSTEWSGLNAAFTPIYRFATFMLVIPEASTAIQIHAKAMAATVPIASIHAHDEPAVCFGGQGTDPKEQNTQQSPCFGRSRTPHPSHW
jgi:hypothetical protein